MVTAMILRKFSNQMGKKRRRCSRRLFSDLRMKVFRNLFDGEAHRQEDAKISSRKTTLMAVISKRSGPFRPTLVDGGLEAVEPILLRPRRFRHGSGAERELGHRISQLVKAVVEQEAGAPAVGEDDRFVVLS